MRIGLLVVFASLLIQIRTFALPELVVPLSAKFLNSNHEVFDSIEVKTTLINKGTTGTPAFSISWPPFMINVDSLTVRYHSFPIGYVLNAGDSIAYTDTIVVERRAFSISTQADSHNEVAEINEYNNVRSLPFDFHPKRDTVTLRDTIRTHDTLVIRDTVIKKDTVKYCPPTLAKTSQEMPGYSLAPGMDALGRATKFWARCKE